MRRHLSHGGNETDLVPTPMFAGYEDPRLGGMFLDLETRDGGRAKHTVKSHLRKIKKGPRRGHSIRVKAHKAKNPRKKSKKSGKSKRKGGEATVAPAPAPLIGGAYDFVDPRIGGYYAPYVAQPRFGGYAWAPEPRFAGYGWY